MMHLKAKRLGTGASLLLLAVALGVAWLFVR